MQVIKYDEREFLEMRKIFAFILCISILFVSNISPVSAITTGVDDAVHDDILETLFPTRKVDDNVIDAGTIFEEKISLELGSVSASQGGEVALPLTLKKNEGFSHMELHITYDGVALKLTGVTSSLDVSYTDSNGYVTLYISNTDLDEEDMPLDYTALGEIAKLNFTTKNASGVYTVAFKSSSYIFNHKGNILNDGYTDGKITLQCNHTYSGTYIVLKEAGCESTGLKYRTCTICGYRDTVTVAALGHTNTSGEWAVYRPADCVNGGVEALFCDRCDTVIEARVTSAIGHSMGWAVEKAPTCYEEGIRTYMCIICGGEKGESQSIAKLSHIAGEEKVLKEPTCSEEGVLATVCQNCPEVLSSTPIPKLTHENTRLFVVTAPTSESEGVGEYRCIVCGEVTESVIFDKAEGVIRAEKDVIAYKGDTIKIPVIIEQNSGFSYGIVRVGYDVNSLDFVSVTAGDVTQDITVGTLEVENGKINVLICMNDTEVRKNGTLFYLEFTVKENAVSGVIDIYYDPNNDFADKNGDRVFFNFEDVNVTVRSSMLGDTDGDKKVDTTDLAKMKLYLVGAVDTVNEGADIDMNGKVDTVDLALLKLYLAGSITLE